MLATKSATSVVIWQLKPCKYHMVSRLPACCQSGSRGASQSRLNEALWFRLQMLQQGLKELRHRERQDELTISKQQREIAALQLSLQGMRQQLKVSTRQMIS